ncbi:MAG TPA: hypothetical protein VFC59_09380 [Cryobacterium sp.]|nr:hypothetical protein [Cryobacterium sp.]
MSEWSVPSGATPQDYPRQPRDGIGDLVARFHAFQVEVRDRFNNLLKQAGIRVEKDLVRFVGAVRIEGTLSLPAGIIDNDALASPVVPAPFYAAASNFAVPNAWTTALEHSLTTPAGFTQAVVIATAWARIKNTSGATASSFGTLASINGVSGPWDDDGAIPNNNFANLEATYATLVTGLTEGVNVPILTRVFSSPALSADADNEATINGVVLWLR